MIQYKNNGKRWTEEDDQKLLPYLEKPLTNSRIQQLQKRLHRTAYSVESRLFNLRRAAGIKKIGVSGGASKSTLGNVRGGFHISSEPPSTGKLKVSWPEWQKWEDEHLITQHQSGYCSTRKGWEQVAKNLNRTVEAVGRRLYIISRRGQLRPPTDNDNTPIIGSIDAELIKALETRLQSHIAKAEKHTEYAKSLQTSINTIKTGEF